MQPHRSNSEPIAVVVSKDASQDASASTPQYVHAPHSAGYTWAGGKVVHSSVAGTLVQRPSTAATTAPDTTVTVEGPRLGNPSPLGLASFAATTFLASMVNARIGGVTIPAVAIGMGYFYGGFVQLLAGCMEFVRYAMPLLPKRRHDS